MRDGIAELATISEVVNQSFFGSSKVPTRAGTRRSSSVITRIPFGSFVMPIAGTIHRFWCMQTERQKVCTATELLLACSK
jgi:hypothetical protein